MELVRQLEQSFSIGLGPHKHYREHRLTIDLLTKAITRARTVQMRYYSASRNAASRREVDPYRLRYVAGGLYLVGYCHWRKDVRMLAVERIKSLTLMTAAWAKDRVWHASQQIKKLKDGRLRMTFTVADTRELVGWVLSFGSGVRVVRPDSLRVAVVEEADSILRGNSGSTLSERLA